MASIDIFRRLGEGSQFKVNPICSGGKSVPWKSFSLKEQLWAGKSKKSGPISLVPGLSAFFSNLKK